MIRRLVILWKSCNRELSLERLKVEIIMSSVFIYCGKGFRFCYDYISFANKFKEKWTEVYIFFGAGGLELG